MFEMKGGAPVAVKTKEKKPKKQKTNRVREALLRLHNKLYKWNYAVGIFTVSKLRRVWRHIRRETRPMRGWLLSWFHRNFSDRLREFWQKVRGIKTELQVSFSTPRTPFKEKPAKAIADFCGCVRTFARRYPAVVGRTASAVAPVLAVLVLVLTVQYWTTADFGIRVEYEGVDVGYIADEGTYMAAADLARERVYSEDGEFTISDTPTMRVKLLHAAPLMDTSALCDEILRTKGDAISEASGLYVDGKFVGSMKSRAELDGVLDAIKKTYCDGGDNERAEFIQDVTVSDGLYLTESVMTAEKMKEKLTAQAVVKKEHIVQPGDTLSSLARKYDMTINELRTMNPDVKNDVIYDGEPLMVQRPQPFLRVKVVRTVQYTEKIDYTTEKEYDNTKLVTYEKVKVRGVEGSQDVTAEITYVDGVQQSKTILSIEVTKQPVTKVVVVGTKKVVNSSGGNITVGDGVSTGSMLWPVPICRNMSRGWGYGHYALDICNGPVTVNRKPFIAADGGTVVFAGWNAGGYGYMVKIQHANGLQTLYAHCHTLYVVTGQKVSRGQTLGLIGSTGRSSGPHLHFEVIRNGSRVNPLLYVNRYK